MTEGGGDKRVSIAVETQTTLDQAYTRPTKLELMMNPKLKDLIDENGDYIDTPLQYAPVKQPAAGAVPGAPARGPDGEFKAQIPLSRSPKRFLPHNLKGHLASGPVRLLLPCLAASVALMQEEKAMAAAPSGPIEASRLIAYVQERKKKKILLRGEFLLIRKSAEEGEREVGLSKENAEKNQYAEIIPYDRNRVILNLLPGDAHSDYINASYIDSWYEKQAYLITQGVRTKAASIDFWRLVWESETNCVIMLTKVFDFMRVMCLQYWPQGTATYGDVQVQLLETKTYAHFILRTFKLSRVNKEGVGAPRLVTQFHFIEWELDSFPYISAFLELRRRVRKFLAATPSPGPVLVHCSNGGARSGTFCSVDANLEMLEKENCADVFGFAKQLLYARPHTLDTLEQYVFMYDVLVEWIVCKVAPIPLEGLQDKSSLYKNKKNRAEQEGQDTHEYNTLHGDSKDYTYINAVHVDGFTRKAEWIVTEWPKAQTIDSLWALVFDHNAHTLVNLTSGGSPKSYPPLIHNKGKQVYGPFIVEVLSYQSYPSMTSHMVKVMKRKAVNITSETGAAPPPPPPPTAPSAQRKAVTLPANLMDNSVDSLKKGANFNPKAELEAAEKDDKTFMISEIMASGSNAIQEAETRICCILTAKMWPIEHKVPLSTSGLLDLIKMARSWRKRAPDRPETKPTIVLSHNGRSRVGIYIAANVCIEEMEMDGEVDVFHAVKMIRINRPQLVDSKDEYKYLYDLMLHWYMTNPDYSVYRTQHQAAITHQAG